MAMAVAPRTPKPQIAEPAFSTPSPGTWRHPKFDEIARRQGQNIFDESNVRRIIWNGGALFILWVVDSFIGTEIRSTMVPKHVQAYTQPILIVLNMVLLFNIGTALLPLAKQKDNLTDIPLTPTQRALLGLDPNITPSSTPTSQYITPPRYPRSPTPRTSSPGSRSGSNSDSPLSRKENSLGRQENNSPYSPSASPMWQKAVGGSRESTRRNSYGTPSPLGRNFGGKDASVLGVPSTPSPSIGRGASVGLNSKWLYERGRASPRSSGIYS